MPYRTDPEELVRWVEARARGRSAGQLRASGFAPKSLEGVTTSAVAFGFADENASLTARGERFALAAPQERHRLLHEAVLRFPPYGDLLRALAERGPPEVTEVQWIETWWATHGFGSSESNRREAAATFGRLVESVGLGRYVPGRRGHPTRIEWAADALPLFSPAAESAPPPAPPPPAPPAPAPGAAPAAPARATGSDPPGGAEVNRISVALRHGRTARLEVPVRLPSAEKQRLLELLSLLIAEE